MVLVGAQGRRPHPELDALELLLRRIPTPELSERRARSSRPGFRWCCTVPYLRFENAVADGRTLRRLERHTRALELARLRGPARVVAPPGARTGYLLALAAAQGRLPLVFDVEPPLREPALEFGLRLVARFPEELEGGGYGLVSGDPVAWLEAARGLEGEVYLLAPLAVALELKQLLSGTVEPPSPYIPSPLEGEG